MFPMICRTAAFVVLTFWFGLLAFAQDMPYQRQGNVEGNVFIGASYGADSWRGMGGGNMSYAATRTILPYFEYSYFPGVPREVSSAAGRVRFSIPLSDFHAGIHYRIPVGQKYFVPYLVAAIGGIRSSSASYKATVNNPAGLPFTLTQTVPGETFLATNYGGGIRHYIFGESSGVRTEFKVYVPHATSGPNQSLFNQLFYKATFGLFYQFR